MMLFDVYELKPVWKTYYEDDDHIGIKLLLSLAGYLAGFWIFPILVSLTIGKLLLESLGYGSSAVLIFFSSVPGAIISALLSASIGVGLILRYAKLFEGFQFAEEWQVFQHDYRLMLQDMGFERIDLRMVLIIGFTLSIGMVSGLVFGFVFMIPIFLLFFMFVFIFSNFIILGTSSMIFSFLVSYSVITILHIANKLHIEEPPQPQVRTEYPVSKRNLDIIKSKKEPIVCPNCRSFIPVDSDYCPICEYQIDQSA